MSISEFNDFSMSNWSKIQWFFHDFVHFYKFQELFMKFNDFSMILKHIWISMIFQELWEPCIIMSKWWFLVQISNDGNMSYPRLLNETPMFESGLTRRRQLVFFFYYKSFPVSAHIKLSNKYVIYYSLYCDFAPSMDRNLSLCILPNRLYMNNLFDITVACPCLAMGNMSSITEVYCGR